MKKNKKLIFISFTVMSFIFAADLAKTFTEFDKIKKTLAEISPKLEKFNKHLDNGTYAKLHKNEKLPLEEAEKARGAAVAKLEELTKALDLNNPKSPLLGDFEAQKKLVEYYLYFQKFSDGIDLCNNLRPAFEKYTLRMNKDGLKVDPLIIECQNFEKKRAKLTFK